ncbi:glycosyltransferase family 2 protein [Lactococcus hodotermopsidis]|uniref:glycosyltransferase family 2 protein n=1 Tax=Pseudolactococcus hodotermopsidis TaxID=2709157 RepID=UPI003530C2A7
MTKTQEFQAFQYDLADKSWQDKVASFQLTTSEIVTPNPKVSVIIANFNNAPYLNKMMDSLTAQTLGMANIQVMFIDDKSTDNSIAIIKPYLTKNPNIELYQLDENTGGAHGPRNVGLLNARGEYLVILDADDWYDDKALKYLSDLLDESGDDFAVSGLVQSVDGHLSLKSKPYYVDGDFKNRSIQELPTEFYGWLGPQSIMLRRSLVVKHNLHFVDQRVADDVTFFYEAMRFAKIITQGKELTTYLNRDADNTSLSQAINRNFMMSWLRALSYINETFPDDTSKERFLSRRIEWLIHDFCLKRNIGYKFSKARLQDFKAQLDLYLGNIKFDPSPYFRNDFRKTAWLYLKNNDISGLYRFIYLFSVRWVLNRKLNMKTVSNQVYYYPQLLPLLTKTRLEAYAVAESLIEGTLKLKVFSYKKLVGFEIFDLAQPFESRKELTYRKLSETDFEVNLPKGYENNKSRFVVIFEGYFEIGVQRFASVM